MTTDIKLRLKQEIVLPDIHDVLKHRKCIFRAESICEDDKYFTIWHITNIIMRRIKDECYMYSPSSSQVFDSIYLTLLNYLEVIK